MTPRDPMWPIIARRIKDRAGGGCECRGECGIETHTIPGEPACPEDVVGVVQLDGNPENVADSNLRAVCLRCRLLIEGDPHARAATTQTVQELDLGGSYNESGIWEAGR